MAPIRDDFGAVRPIRRLNRLTQALLAIALAVVVNTLASLPEFRLRHDMTADRRHSLAPESAETVRAAGRRSPVGVGRNQGWVKAVLLTGDTSEPAQIIVTPHSSRRLPGGMGLPTPPSLSSSRAARAPSTSPTVNS